jgi:hypothetical protein
METDDLLEEGCGDRCCGVGVAQRDEVHVFGEVVNHCQDDGLPACLQEALDEVHGDVLPYRGGDVERLEEASQVEVLRLLALADRAPANEFTDEAAVVHSEEHGSQQMKHLLGTLMANAMGLV